MIEKKNWKYVFAAYNLTPEQWKKLDDAHFLYSQDEVFNFQKAHEELVLFKEKFGHLIISQSYVTKDGYLLGRTVSHLRTARMKNDRFAQLQPSQIKELNKIEFVWKIRAVDVENFIKRFAIYNMYGDKGYVNSGEVLRDGYEIGQEALLIRLGENFKNELKNSHLPKLTKEQKQKLIDNGFLFQKTQTAEKVMAKH